MFSIPPCLISPCPLEPVTHVIFDIDGTVLDTEGIYTEVMDHISIKLSGQRFDMDVKQRMMGRHRIEALEIFKQSYGIIEEIEIIDNQVNEMLYAKFTNVQLMPGVEKLVRHLYNFGIPMAVGTGSDEKSFEMKTQSNRDFFDKYFHHVVLTSDPEVKFGKPAPDIFLIACQRFDANNAPKSTSNCLVIEDAVNGVEAALKANMQVLWVPSLPNLDLNQLPAHLVLPSLEHFKPEFFQLPSF